MTTEFLKLLCSSAKLDRDRGVSMLEKNVQLYDCEVFKSTENALENFMVDQSGSWEIRLGGLLGVKTLLSQCGCHIKSTKNSCSSELYEIARQQSLKLLEDKECRVRTTAGEVLGLLCQSQGIQIYLSCQEELLQGITGNLERTDPMQGNEQEQNQAQLLSEKVSPQGAGKRRGSADAEQIFHDTAGWRNLETWMKCLQNVIEGCGVQFNPHIESGLLDLIFSTLTHTNRFVRETGYYVCGAMVGCNRTENGSLLLPAEENTIYQNGQKFAQHLANGLADNWSQVRLASSVATRTFLLGLDEESQSVFYDLLIPPMCLNRYYVAEGVRIYNQDTWKIVTKGDGSQLVEKHVKSVVDFYISQTEADNHAVREAACACIAELGLKINPQVVRPYVNRLLDALLICFKDDSWPVRDASCVACGNFVVCFPDESRSMMDSLYPLFYGNLQDNIPSVREGAALALSNVVSAYGAESLQTVSQKVREGFEGVSSQPENTEKYSGLDKGPATYGVAKRLRDNDADLHTDKQMYSCGSLAPKMHRGNKSGGCMDHRFRREPEPWELADGCMYLVAELSRLEEAKSEVGKLLPLLVKAVDHHHYSQHVHLLETFCKQLPIMAEGLGKRIFKMYLEIFLDSIFYSLSCDNALTSSAASQCLTFLSNYIGANILRGRVENYNPRYIEQLCANQFIAPL